MTSLPDDTDNVPDTNDHGPSTWDHSGLSEQLGHSFFSRQTDGPIIGTPEKDAQDWVLQTTPFTCDVVSQEMILHEFGIDVSEAQLTYDAASHGWLTDAGTTPQDMAQLLNFHGVQTHTNYNGSIEALTSELAHGHKVIVAVDSQELWNPGSPQSSWFNPHTADHAITIIGLDMSKPDHPMVLVNDSGDPDGADKSYPLDQFLEAWGGSGDMYVATDLAPPHLAENSLLGSNFQPDPSGIGGMYMNSEYWATFLKTFGPIIALGWFSSQAQSESTPFKPVTRTNPWESMTPAERNDLFSRI